MLYNFAFISAEQECKSAIIIHITSPSCTSLSPPYPPLRYHRVLGWAYCVIWKLLNRYILHMLLYIVTATFSFFPTLSFPHGIHKSILYICTSMTSLEIHSSISFSQYLYICNLCFSDLLHPIL